MRFISGGEEEETGGFKLQRGGEVTSVNKAKLYINIMMIYLMIYM